MLSEKQLAQLAIYHSEVYADWIKQKHPQLHHKAENENQGRSSFTPQESTYTRFRNTISHARRDSSKRSSLSKRRPIFDSKSKAKSQFDSKEKSESLSPNPYMKKPQSHYSSKEKDPKQTKGKIKQFGELYGQKKYHTGLGLLNPAELANLIDNVRKKQLEIKQIASIYHQY